MANRLKGDKYFLWEAIKQSQKSLKDGGFPAGAVVVKDGKIISRGVSQGFKLNDSTSHSETSSIRKACRKLKTTNLQGSILYASLQPCLMCFSAANWAGISKIVFGCQKTEKMLKGGCYEGKNDIYQINSNNSRQIILEYIPDFESESLRLLDQWLKGT